jgi:hypothetical protein
MSISRHNNTHSTTTSRFTTHQPSPDYIKQAFTTTLQDNASLQTTLANIRADYLALETEHRSCMAAYIAARDEARKWQELCADESGPEQAMRAMHSRFGRRMFGAEKMGEIWRKGEKCVWIRERKGERLGGKRLERFKEDFGRCRAEWRREWGEWRVRRREKSERDAEAARNWTENY